MVFLPVELNSLEALAFFLFFVLFIIIRLIFAQQAKPMIFFLADGWVLCFRVLERLMALSEAA